MSDNYKPSNTTVNGGIGFTGALQILFIAFKLLGVIDWSWAWVLSPLWISAALGIIVLIVLFIVAIAVVD